MLVALGAWLAWRALRPAKTGTSAEPSLAARLRPGFWLTLVLTIANPLTVLLFVGFSAQLSLRGDIGAVLYYSLWIALGSVLVNVGLGLCGASIGKWVADRRVITVLNFASGLAIAGFGIRGLVALV
jgi:threonine/homoserine/homoserine lactone efflux protein